jgi:adenine-specific DNA-methyltransferase
MILPCQLRTPRLPRSYSLGIARRWPEADGSGSRTTDLGALQTKFDDRLLEDRRKLGAFYTPEKLSQILSTWAIRTESDLVLEPSFGGCGFLQAAQSALLDVDCKSPRRQIYGCDVDPIAFEYLASVFGAPVDLERFVQGDFLKLQTPNNWPTKFDAILANPPYIPYQDIGTDLRAELSSRNFDIDGVGGRASLWAYFMAHAVSFLADDGRMAWVLPGAFLQAEYAAPVRRYLGRNFRRAAAFIVRERLFLDAGTDEETIVLLADGYRQPAEDASIALGEAGSLAELSDFIASWDRGEWQGNKEAQRPATLSLTADSKAQIAKLRSNKFYRTLGQVAKVQVGIVTGANSFFVIPDAARKTAGLSITDCKSVIGKFQAASGLDFADSDHANLIAAGGSGYLVDSHGRLPNDRIERYLNLFDEERRATVSTFKKRAVWSEPDDRKLPDAFFPVMHHYGPRIVINAARCQCTNTIHRLYFDAELKTHQRKLVAISVLSSFSQLSAELVGRRYGSGVLKHEPREAEKIEVLLPDLKPKQINSAFNAINRLLRKGDRQAAMAHADSVIFAASEIEGWASVSAALIDALGDMRRRRRPQSRKQH